MNAGFDRKKWQARPLFAELSAPPRDDSRTDPTQRLIQANGQPYHGTFPSALQHINYRDSDFRSPMGRRVGASGKQRRFRQFQYFGLISPELVGGCVLVQLSLFGVGFVYLYQPSSGRMLERRFKLPLGFGARFSQTLDDGVRGLCHGRNLLRPESRTAPREKRLLVELDNSTRIDACFSEEASSSQPMCLYTSTVVNGWIRVQEAANVRCRGDVRSALGDHDLQALDAFTHHDWSVGYTHPETFWNWTCLSGEADGSRVGLNLSRGVNEASFTENCYRLDGKLLKVDSARFDLDRDQLLRPWTIRSYDGQAELRFETHGMHQERLNLGLPASNSKQTFGCFSGMLRPRGRAEVRIERFWGFVENQYAKWQAEPGLGMSCDNLSLYEGKSGGHYQPTNN